MRIGVVGGINRESRAVNLVPNVRTGVTLCGNGTDRVARQYRGTMQRGMIVNSVSTDAEDIIVNANCELFGC